MSIHCPRRFLSLIFTAVITCVLLAPTASHASSQPPPPPTPGQPEKGKIIYWNPNGDAFAIDLRDGKGGKKSLMLYGEQWRYKTSFGGSRETQQKAIRAWVADAGGSLITDTSGQLAARIQSNENERLVYLFDISSKKTSVTIYLERLLTADHPISLTIGGKGPDQFSFRFDHDGRHYQSFIVEFERKDVTLEGASRSAFDNYKRKVYLKHHCRIEHGARQVILDAPQYAGTYKWYVYTHSKQPQTVRISLEQGPSLPELKDGPRLGAVRVRHLPYGSVRLQAEWDARMEHPAFEPSKLRADRTPEGDTIFWVPSGYWQVEAVPPKDAGLTIAQAHMIPVHAGRTTDVDWPRSLSGIFAPKATGRLEILDARHRSDVAEVDVSLMELDDSIVPRADRVQCYEGGQPGRVVSVEPLKTPLNVVLLLDSSGSMKGSMTQAVHAVKTFVQRFPADARITVVDFDTKPKVLKSGSRAELLGSLDGVRANGATALFDSILLGLNRLKAESRKALVVFTDGVDANWNDTGPGSRATKAEVMQAVERARTPLFTIGFGKKPDVDTLTRVADLSGGAYYEAHDKSSLDSVFARISADLGRQYRVTYERPQAVGLSDVPVMALVVDNSGSMDMSPSKKGCDYRIEKVRQILKDFTHAFPQDFLVQLLTFSNDTRVSQVITTDAAPMLRGLSMMLGNGGTDILGSTRAALKTLKAVPSTRRYLVYLTDAAMKVEQKDRKEFDILLASLRDEGIQSLFVGVVDKDQDGAFAHAAKMSGGRCVISTDLDRVKRTFDEMASQVVKPVDGKKRIALRLTLADRDERGRNRLFSAGKFVDFPQRPEARQAASPEAVAWAVGEPLTVYDDVVGATISGDDLLIRDVRVAKRLPLHVSGANKAMTLSASEMIFLSRLRGLDPPRGYRYLALPLTMTNRLKPQKVAVFKDGSSHPAAWMAGSAAPVRYEQAVPPYLIPDLTRHLFLRWNQEATLPVSPVTWLCQEPLLVPGERALSIHPEQPVNGACVFLVPDGVMTQASLHFYDINYGHIHLPLVGVMPAFPTAPENLLTQPDKGLGSSFALRLTNVIDQPAIGQVCAGKGYVFRVIEAFLTSKVQALLSIDPAKRFSYHLSADRGDLVFRLHPATECLPLGFHRATMVAPGVRNMIRLAFRLPGRLAQKKDKGYLFVDVRGGGVRLDLASAAFKPAALGPPSLAGRGIDVFVNAAGVVKDRVAGQRGNFVALDVTFRDHADGSHTRIGPLLVLKKKGSAAVNQQAFDQRLAEARQKAATKKHRGLGDFGGTGVSGPAAVAATGVCRPRPMGDKLIFGLDEQSVIFDGQSRRGVMLFDLPGKEKIADWELGSLILEEAARPLLAKPFKDAVLLSERLEIKDDIAEGFWRELEKKVAELQARREARGYERPGRATARPVNLDTADLGKERVPVLGAITPGARRLKKAARQGDSLKFVAGLQWVPGRGEAWSQRYSPEAVSTQGWGAPSDLARLAERLLNEQGLATTRAEVKPTDQGKKTLAERAGVAKISIGSLPALRFEDQDGRKHFVVFPWCRELDQLEGLVKWDGSDREPSDRRRKISIQVELDLTAVASKTTASGRMAADSLAGGGASKTKAVTVLAESFYDDEAGLDALDIGYTEIREQGQPALKCILDGPSGRRVGRNSVRLNAWTVQNERISVSMDGRRTTAEQPVDPQHPITGRFHVLSVNAPDLNETGAAELQTLRAKAHAAATAPDGLSSLQWYGRCVIDRFIAAQARYENRLARDLGLKVGRTLNGRCILVSVERPDAAGKVSTRMDLLHAANDIHGGDGADIRKASHAFALMSGLTAARLEAAAVPGGSVGLFELWDRCPEGTQLAFIDRTNKQAFIDMLQAKGYPQSVMNRIKACGSAMLFPSTPAVIGDTARWGWLEIDPKTYQVVSRLDSGAAGAMIENLIGDLYQQATSYLVGAMVGIDVSLWSVSAYSLELEDFEEISKKAETFAMGLAKRFEVKDASGTVGIGIGGPPSGERNLDRYVKFSLDFKGFAMSNNMLGFGNGYKDAVGYYFSKSD